MEPFGEAQVRLIAHPELLGQAFDNLLENACKYSSPGSPIQVVVQRGDQSVKLSIHDSGIGMDEEDLAHLFEPFYRSPRAREQGIAGTGLGLALVRRIASALAASIRVQSTLGQGTVFILELPASPVIMATSPQPKCVEPREESEHPSAI